MVKRRYTKKRRLRRRTRKYRKLRRLRTLRTPLPTKLLVKLKYYDTFTINPGLGTIGSYIFSANGMYDPNISGTGHQPRGFDQLMTMYDHFTVIASKATVQPLEFTGLGLCQYALALQDGATPIGIGASSIGDNVCEYNNVMYSNFPHVSAGSAIQTNQLPKLKKKFGIKKFFHAKNPLTAAQWEGDVTSNPIEQAYYGVYYWSESAADPPAVTFKILIQYTAVLHEPQQPIQS